MPLRFTPFLGILAGIIATLIILILTVITVIKIKYKYGKAVGSSASASPGSSGGPGDRDQNIHYKSFKFDCSDKAVVAAGAGVGGAVYGSECAVSPHSEGADKLRDLEPGDQPRERGVMPPNISAAHCDSVSSWTPFLSRNCEESVI